MAKETAKANYFGELFPTKLSLFVFLGYIVFFIAQSILVKASQTNNAYTYNVTCVVMLTEVLKLILSAVIYLKDHSLHSLWVNFTKYRHVLILYYVPALLYCFYNNLSFRNLRNFDPTTYNLLMQFRVVITGVVFQILFKKKLSGKQWFSLTLLTLGCVIKQFSVTGESRASNVGLLESLFSVNILFLLFQMLCSCLAGVYNEFLLKDTGADLHIMIHNIFMYLDSIVCNMAVLTWNGQIAQLFDTVALTKIFGQPLVLLVIVNGSLCGIIVSVFLRNLNSILKTFAGASDLLLTAVLCWVVFDIPIDTPTIMSITVVSSAIYLYSQNPVVNKVKDTKADAEDKEKLLDQV